jgi:hypothetical protein
LLDFERDMFAWFSRDRYFRKDSEHDFIYEENI